MDWKKVTRISVSAVLSLLILCSIVGMVLLGVGVSNANKTGTFNLFGYSFHLNKSTAMEPDIMRNDLVVVRHADFSEIEAGDYAAFYYEEDGTEHLLVRKVEAVDGLTYRVADTSGNALDISAENARFLGIATQRSEALGQAVLFLQSEDGKMIFLGWTAGVAICLIGLTILFHLIWKMLAQQRSAGPADGITGEVLDFDQPVELPQHKS